MWVMLVNEGNPCVKIRKWMKTNWNTSPIDYRQPGWKLFKPHFLPCRYGGATSTALMAVPLTPVESQDTVVASTSSPFCNASQTAARLYGCFKNIHTAYPGFLFTIEDVVRGISSQERTLYARDDAVKNEPAGAWLWTKQLAAHDMEILSVEDIASQAGVDLSAHRDTSPMGRWGILCQLVGPILLVTGVREDPLITLVPSNSVSTLNRQESTDIAAEGYGKLSLLPITIILRGKP